MEDTNSPVLYPGWEMVRKIGTGSFGTVYEIERDLFGKKEKAALKLISIPQNESDVDELYGNGFDDASITAHFHNYLADIVKEYSLMAEMKGHTNVVYCDDIRYVQHNDGFGWDIYIKMELLTPMMKALGKEVTDEQVIKLGRDICNALVLCKSRNIIHRDIKPQNIFVSNDGDYKLGDFGIAKTVEKTSGGTKIGTYNYMAPEVYNNEPYGHAADIYSLGLVMFWLLNDRRLPFNPLPPAVPTASEMDEARLRRFQGEPIPAPAHGSEELKQIVLKACAYDPKDRYQSAAEMLSALEHIGKSAVQEGSFSQLPEKEDDLTVGHSLKKKFEDEQDRTEGIWKKSEEDKTVSVWTNPDPSNSGNVHTAEKKRENKKFIWIITACIVLSLTAGIFGISAAEKTNKSTNEVAEEMTDKISKNVVAVSAGFLHTVGLRSDGTVVASGGNEDGQCDVSDWNDIVSINTGEYHTVGLRSDGTVVATGRNEEGQCDVSSWRDIVSINAGAYHTVGLRADGTVVATGRNEEGQCDVSSWCNIVSINTGLLHTVGLRADGTVVASGVNVVGQCDVSGWHDIVSISAGDHHTVGLRADGTVVAVGSNLHGQCDTSDWNDIVLISAGFLHTVGLRSDGTVVAAGEQVDISGWNDIVAISAGYRHAVGLKSDGTVMAANDNIGCQCFTSDWSDIVAISAGYRHAVGLKSDGTVVATGDISFGQCNVSDW